MYWGITYQLNSEFTYSASPIKKPTLGISGLSPPWFGITNWFMWPLSNYVCSGVMNSHANAFWQVVYPLSHAPVLPYILDIYFLGIFIFILKLGIMEKRANEKKIPSKMREHELEFVGRWRGSGRIWRRWRVMKKYIV